MILFWKWLIRPVVVLVLGAGAAASADEAPAGGLLIGMVALALAVWFVVDILHTVLTW